MQDVNWAPYSGRDSDGDKFNRLALVHGSGRILASVNLPMNADEYQYFVYFFCEVPDEILMGSDFRFVSAESAQAFVEKILGSFDWAAGKKKAVVPAVEEVKKEA